MDKSSILKDYFLLFIAWLFLGWFGAHRFYMKKYKSALLLMLLGIYSIIQTFNLGPTFISFDAVLYTFTYFIMTIQAGAGMQIITLTFFYFITTLFLSGIGFVIIWWLIDLRVIYKYAKHSS